MTVLQDLRRYIRILDALFVDDVEPRALHRARAVERLIAGESIDPVASASGINRRHLLTWQQVVETEGLATWLGKKVPDGERLGHARSGIAQMLLGQLAEEHFEQLSTGVLGGQGFRVEDQRVGRTDTDYRLLDPEGRPICRLNIKFHGTLFQQAEEYVELPPRDCFALATYKIHGALERQQEERLPFVFLVISVPDFPRDQIEQNVSDDLAWLAALSGRAIEERIVLHLAREAQEFLKLLAERGPLEVAVRLDRGEI